MPTPEELKIIYFKVFILKKNYDLQQWFYWAFSNVKSNIELSPVNFSQDFKEGRLYIFDSNSFPAHSKIPKNIHGGVFAMIYYDEKLFFPGQEKVEIPFIIPSKNQTLESTLQRNFNFDLDTLIGAQIDINTKGIELVINQYTPKRFQSIEEMLRTRY